MKQIQFSPPDISQLEIDEVVDTLKSGWITTGPKTKQFEREIAAYCGTKKAVCLNSATACMELTLRLFGIGEGDEVIVPAYTYTATASVVTHVGAKIVMMDCSHDSYEMDYDLLEAAITSKTKAIIPVDLGGVLCDYQRIYEIVEKQKSQFRPANSLQEALGRCLILADGAHSFGAFRGENKSGSFADFTSFSFHAVKNLTTGEGGAITWRNDLGLDDDLIYQQFMLMSLHGQSKDALAKTKLGAWEYDIVAPFYKCNMTDIMAAIGLAQLRRYPELLQKRYTLVRAYEEALPLLEVETLPHLTMEQTSSCHLFLVRLLGKSMAERNAFVARLAEQGIATNVHYKPLPLLTAYKNLGFAIEDYPNAYNRYVNEITLPLYSILTEDDVELVCETFKKIGANKICTNIF